MPYISIRQNGQDLGWRELDGAVVIGRQKECDICMIDMLMSRNHCRIEPAAKGGWVLVDLESKNGTWHDETQVERMELTPGTRVRVGRTTVTFHPGTPPAEGRYVSKASLRPNDPHEALAGTVMGMVVADEEASQRPADPWAARRAARPRPTPRPSGESGIYPAITETSAAAVHEPSSGACALLRESRQTDEARLMPDLSEELSVREPLSPRARPLPRPILLEVQLAEEQDARAAAASGSSDEVRGRAIMIGERPRRRAWHARLPLTQEGVIVILALALLGFFRLAINPSHPQPAVAAETIASEPEPSFDVGVMASTPADLPPLSVTETPPFFGSVSPAIGDDEDAPSDELSPVRTIAVSAKRLKQSLTWDVISGAVRDYQREVRRFILEVPSTDQTAATPTGH